MARPKKFVLTIAILVLLFLIFVPNLVKDESPALIALSNHEVIVLPHIDTPKESRQLFIKSLNIKPSDVIVLSTNHFDISSENILYGNSPWEMLDGNLNKSNFESIENVPSNDLIKTDHGIRNVISDLSLSFKNSNFHSYLIKNKTSKSELEDLEQRISSYCERSRNCLIVGSVDFSHYNPSAVAELHDEFSIKALAMGNSELIAKAETDSPEVLSLICNLATNFDKNSFKIYENKNSGEVSGNFEMETTSWIIGRFSGQEERFESSVQIMFAGDVMMDRLVNHRFSADFKKLFDLLKDRFFTGVDASIANFEGPINDGPVPDDISVNNLVFNFPLNSLDGLKYIGLNVFSLANNHTLNDGNSGLERTRKILADNKMITFGSPKTIDEFTAVELNSDPKVSLIGINELEGVDRQILATRIKEEKAKGNFVIVYPHWGAEYQISHGTSQEVLAHLMIDNGADLIIGSHPHVIQDSEVYKNKLILYSLGNFVFDQTFSEETQQGLVVGVSITNDKQKISLIPVESIKLKPFISKGNTRLEILKRVMPKDFLNQLESGIIDLPR